MSKLLAEVAALVTDLDRLDLSDNDDPMRYSKRVAKETALRILSDAVQQAQRVADLPALIDRDIKDMKEATKP